MDKIINLLKQYKSINDYKIIEKEEESSEVFFVHEKLETVRKTDTKDILVTIYVDHDSFRGEASFSLYKTDEDAAIKGKIENAIHTASILDNKKFELPKDERASFTSNSNFKDYELIDVASMIFNTLEETKSMTNAKLNATEVFVYKTKLHLLNSQNIDKSYVKYSALIETIPTYDTPSDSVELYYQTRISFFDKKSLKQEILSKLIDVEARANAKKPTCEINVPVLFRSSELSHIVSNLVSDQNYASLFIHANKYKQGDVIQSNDSFDKFSVRLYGTLKNCSESSYFDEDGVTLGRKEIIKNGIFVGSYGSNKYAKYLNKKVTGNLSVISLKEGTTPLKDLKSVPHLECASFSGLQIDLNNDYIGGEVRLAYFFDGKETKPVTGISISAKLSDVLNHIKLSKEITYLRRYKGPKYALIEGFKVF